MSEKEGRRGEWRHSHWILTKSSADLLLLTPTPTPTCGPCVLVVMSSKWRRACKVHGLWSHRRQRVNVSAIFPAVCMS